jgi:hypothetical protein
MGALKFKLVFPKMTGLRRVIDILGRLREPRTTAARSRVTKVVS